MPAYDFVCPRRLSLAFAALALAGVTACATDSPTSPSPVAGSGGGAFIQGVVASSNALAGAAPGSLGSTVPSAAAPAAVSPASGIRVTVEGTGLAAVVDEAGVFQIDGVPSGGVRLRFTGGTVNVTLDIGNVTDGQFIELQVQLNDTGAVVLAEDRAGKVTLCHAEGKGTYHSINVSENAEADHRRHGDGKVGDPVPARPNMVFDETCRPAGPSIGIEKSTNGVDADSAPGPEILEGRVVTWEYRVTNDGTVDLTSVSVVDDRLGPIDCGGQTSLAPGASLTCTASGTAAVGQYSNLGTVTATGAGPAGPVTVTDSDASHYLGVLPAIEGEDGVKVTLCHRTGAGFYVKIDVGVDAEPAHRGHGDAGIGEPVPALPGKVFSEACAPV